MLRILLLLLLLAPSTAPAGALWLPGTPVHPRDLADPEEPRLGITVDEGSEPRYDVALGLPFPLVRFGEDRPVAVVLEVATFFVLGRESSKFPLRTFDGVFGLGVEGRTGPWHGRFRVLHQSAHRADGDSTVSYPSSSFSRETVSLEGGRQFRDLFVYLRGGLVYHAVPEADPLELAAGFTFSTAPGGPGWFLAGHLSGDAERDWRINQSVTGGVVLGNTSRVRIGLRLYRGFSTEGQYANSRLDTFGLEFQLVPGRAAHAFPSVVTDTPR